MRYKFRGKDRVDNWCYGSLIMYDDTAEIVGFDVYNEGNDAWQTRDIEDVGTIGQYIGKKDANGVEIYEGDIIELFGNKSYHYIVGYSTFYCVYFGKCIETDYNRITTITYQTIEVVGNIYDNKDLIIKYKNEHNKRKL